MPCLDLNLQLPQLPAVFFGPPKFPPVPAFTGDFCCHFSLQAPGVNALIAALNVEVSGVFAATASAAMIGMMAVNEIIAVGQAALDEIRNQLPECPLESASVSF